MNKYDYKNICPFKWFVLENFPFIEDDFDALTNWQLFCKIGKEINKIITSQNEVGQAVEEFTEKFIALYNYVHDYFDNLDVQDEINHKLDEMVEDGTLENILLNYVNVTRVYNTVTDMLADSSNIVNNMKIKTLGYYSVNDGGCAEYLVTNTVDDSTFQIQIATNLYANLIIKNNEINIRQMGAKSLNTNNDKMNIAPLIQKYLNILDNNTQQIKLYIPSGIWFCDEINITREEGFYIYGDERFTLTKKNNATIITNYRQIQNYIFKIGNDSNTVIGWTLKNIGFSSSDYIYSDGDFVKNGYNYVTKAALVLSHATFGITDNIFFTFISGSALSIGSSWENYFKLLNFRHINALATDGVIVFENRITNSDNITATNFEKVMFEAVTGNLMYIKENANMGNCSFGTINFEGWGLTPSVDYVWTNITTENRSDIDNHWAIFNVEGRFEVEINNLELNNVAYRYLSYNDETYCYDTLINVAKNDANPNTAINNIEITGMSMDLPIIQQNDYYINYKSCLCVDTLRFNRTNNKVYLNYNGGRRLQFLPSILTGNSEQVASGELQNINRLTGVIPFYEIAEYRPTNRLGVLYYDANTLNNLKLAVKPYNGASGTETSVYAISGTFIITGDKLYIRAKVPDGSTANLRLDNKSGITHNYQMVGTGDYTIYSWEGILSTFDFGDEVSMRLATGSVGIDVSLDYYKFS